MTATLPRSTPAQAGFTLIELIVVIVILGVLAATALPRFSDLGSDARKAAVRAASGALATTSATAHGKAIVAGSMTANVNMEGTAVAMVNGYPSSAATTATAAGLTGDDWTVTINGRDLHVAPKSAANPDTCKATYSEAVDNAGVLTPAAVAVVDGGC